MVHSREIRGWMIVDVKKNEMDKIYKFTNFRPHPTDRKVQPYIFKWKRIVFKKMSISFKPN